MIRVLEDTGLVVVHSVEDGADATSSGGAGGGAGAGAGAAAASVKAEDGAADGDGDGDGDAATRQKRREYISITRKGYAFMLKDTAVQACRAAVFGPVADLNNRLLVAHVHNAPFGCLLYASPDVDVHAAVHSE